MFQIAVEIKELASSNLNDLVATAASPAKMLRLLQHEIQEYIIALQGDLTRAERRREQLIEQVTRLERTAADWSDKAQVAMMHAREDLARAALLTREATLADAGRVRSDAEAAAAQGRELTQTIADLERKLVETRGRLDEGTANQKTAAASSAAAPSARASRSERFMDRVASLEKRIDFAAERNGRPAPASVDAEIEQLRREAKVTEELAAMKAAAAAKAPRRQRRTKR